jgi:thiamine pyrophosphokinase
MVIGDMDSAFSLPDLPSKTTLLTFPTRKDKTDSQLAVEYCIEQGAKAIDLVMPSVGQTDHFVANILLATLKSVSAWAKAGGKFRILNKAYNIDYLYDSSLTFNNRGGDIVSVVPLSSRIVLDCRGTDYDVKGARIARGHTQGLRNKITSRRATFSVKGEALLWQNRG